MLLLSTAYLGNIQYYTKLLSGHAVIDLHENYVKQSYRNRCDILAANGPVALTVPVYQSGKSGVPTRDIRIDPSKRWQHQHFQTIVSAYRSSPYFTYYEEELAPFYEKRYDFLVDLNHDLQEKILQLLRISVPVTYSEHYILPPDKQGQTAHSSDNAIKTDSATNTAAAENIPRPRQNTASDPDTNISSDLSGLPDPGKHPTAPQYAPEQAVIYTETEDFRSCFSSKPRLMRPDPHFVPEPYYQVFAERYPFLPNLSILDLLCCEGPNALSVLRSSIR